MIRRAVLLLPVLGVVAVDLVAFDYHAAKYLALALGAAVCIGVTLYRRTLAWTDLSWAIWAFVAVRGVMLIESPMPGRSLRWWGLLFALAAVHHAGVSRRWLRRRGPAVLGTLLLALALLAVIQFLAGAKQAQALFANRNFAGAGLAMLLPFALAWDRRLLVPGVFGLAATQSRGGALAAAAALALWFAWSRPRLRLPLLLGLPALAVAAGLALGDTNTVKVRLDWFRTAAAMGLEQPLAGTGAGGFEREYPPRRPIEEHRISGGDKVHAVHNDYLESFADRGLLGLGAHLLLLVVVLRAARRNRVAACSLLAFATASLVDLPLRDPSLLALAFFSLALLARRRPAPAWPAAPALVVVLAFLPAAWGHWRADRLFGRHLENGDRALLDDALTHEPRHPEALLARGREADLNLLLETEPHHAGARYNLTEPLFDADAIPALQDILTKHDPHHTLTRVRLAVLLMKTDAVAAASVLNDAVDADDRPYRPYALLARIHRQKNRLGQAEHFLKKAEARSAAVEVRRERMELEMAKPRGDVTGAARNLSVPEVRHRAGRALAAAERTESEHPRPRVKRDADESETDYAARVQKAQEAWAAELYPLVRGDYRVAAALANALVVMEPSTTHFRILARAERGLRNRKAADRAEGLALLVETQRALDAGDPVLAAQTLKRALRVCPELADHESVLDLERKLTADR